jgi:hypothetical protein
VRCEAASFRKAFPFPRAKKLLHRAKYSTFNVATRKIALCKTQTNTGKIRAKHWHDIGRAMGTTDFI